MIFFRPFFFLLVDSLPELGCWEAAGLLPSVDVFAAASAVPAG